MKLNKQSNVYTVVYIVVMVVVVGAALAFAAMSLKPRQQENADADKMKQILASVHITTDRASVLADYHRYITRAFVVDSDGREVEGVDAFRLDVAKEIKEAATEGRSRLLPVYECTLAPNDVKYILPLSGMGLWGPIWGYLAVNADGSTIYGAYFGHQGETPGLGAEITKEAFTGQFVDKRLFQADGRFIPVTVVKKGLPGPEGADVVDAISGGTITSKGVAAMLDDCLVPYEPFLKSLAAGRCAASCNAETTCADEPCAEVPCAEETCEDSCPDATSANPE